MEQSVDTIIADLRSAVNAKTNAELARKLGVDQSTVSSWRSRGKVPERFKRMLEKPQKGVPVQPSERLGELHDLATTIATVRFSIVRHDLIVGDDKDDALRILQDSLPFWLILNRAVYDLRLKVNSLKVDLRTAQILLLQEDLRDFQSTKNRVEKELAEDIADNPHLKDQR